MITGSSTIRKYVAWYEFRVLYHKKVYAWYDLRILCHKKVYAWYDFRILRHKKVLNILESLTLSLSCGCLGMSFYTSSHHFLNTISLAQHRKNRFAIPCYQGRTRSQCPELVCSQGWQRTVFTEHEQVFIQLEQVFRLSEQMIRYQVPGTRYQGYQVPGTRYLVPGTRYQVLVPGTWISNV